jgi:hypothetical protein
MIFLLYLLTVWFIKIGFFFFFNWIDYQRCESSIFLDWMTSLLFYVLNSHILVFRTLLLLCIYLLKFYLV